MNETPRELLAVETAAVTTAPPPTSARLPTHLASLADKARDCVKAVRADRKPNLNTTIGRSLSV